MDDDQGPHDRRFDDRPRTSASAGLAVTGMVAEPGRLDFAELRGMAGRDLLRDVDQSSVDLADLFAHVRLDVMAEVLMVSCADGTSLAFRIDSLLTDRSVRLELGARDGDGHRDFSQPIRLHGRPLPGGAPVAVSSFGVTTFAAFVRACRPGGDAS